MQADKNHKDVLARSGRLTQKEIKETFLNLAEARKRRNHIKFSTPLHKRIVCTLD